MAMDLNAKAAYIRGMMKGMEFDPTTQEGKIIVAMMDLLEEMAVMHNLWFYNHLMERIRDELDAGTFTAFHDRYVKLLDTRI